MVLSFFGIINVGKAHSEQACHCDTPKSYNLCISFLVMVLENASHGMAVLNQRETNLQSQSSSVLLNSSSKSCKSCGDDD